VSSPDTTIDYRDLLLKYMRCCLSCDGLIHLPFREENEGDSEGILTKAEYDELERLADIVEPKRDRRC
jgi:hypothetical protein